MIKDKEKGYKASLDKLTEQNEALKEKFESFNAEKEQFYQQIVEKLKIDHQNYIEGLICFLFSKFTNQHQVYDYIKTLEISINKSKLNESNEDEKYQQLVKVLEKVEKKNQTLEEQVNNLKKKLQNVTK